MSDPLVYVARAVLICLTFAGKHQMKSHRHSMLTSVRQSDHLDRDDYGVFYEDNHDRRSTPPDIDENVSNVTICGAEMTAWPLKWERKARLMGAALRRERVEP